VGVSEPTITKWVDKGMPCIDRGKKGVPAQFDLKECLSWWRDNIVLADAAKPQKLHEREQLVEIETKELKLKQLKGEVVERVAAVHVIRSLQTQIAAILRQGARRFASQVVGLPDERAGVDALTRMAEEQISELRTPETWRSISEATEDAAQAAVA
jgi:phage terminase Nu1 subunit (DNA packaging protein)